jgi:tRNA threonylcarbamoyladenosine biosynthesis protein TsaE
MPDQWVSALNGKAVSIEDLKEVAYELLRVSKGIKVWLFEGEMGSGKTTFIKTICSQLGVKDATSSPTFSIVNEYNGTNGSVYHFDFYRLEKETEAYDMGVEEYFESGAYCFVEWPERIPSIFPLHYLKVKITTLTTETRSIEYNLL